MLELFSEELARCNGRLAGRPGEPLSSVMEFVPLEVFGELCLDVPEPFPEIRARLPTMASEEVQRNWTGNCGAALMAQSVAFVREVVAIHRRTTGRDLADSRVLDFGCGWGRLLRLLLKYAPAEKLYGVDPWDESIRLCRQHGLACHLAVSDYLPRTLPFPGPFSLIYSFSVFTHLSERAARIALSTLRKVVAEDGLMCLTVRPVEYWHHHGPEVAAGCIERHRGSGFAFVPHANRTPVEGEITYGDTSMTLEHLERLAAGWRITGVEWNPCDPLQVIVAMRPT